MVNAHVKDGRIVHISTDPRPWNPEHPPLPACARGVGQIERTYNPDRLKYPLRRTGPRGSGQFERISWDEALDRIAVLLKEDRDANFVETTPDGKKVNRWLTSGFLAASAGSNEVGYLTHKTVRSMGMLAFDNQARV